MRAEPTLSEDNDGGSLASEGHDGIFAAEKNR
jgi:hypothetical protein